MRLKSKSATIVGYHGYKNMGDDIFLYITCSWLSSFMGVTRCYVASKKDDKNRSFPTVDLKPFYNPIEKIHRILWLSIFAKALKSNYLVFSAGSIFTIQPFMLIYIMLKLLKFIKGQHLKILAIGVSIGPFKSASDEYWCSKLLQIMDHVLLRDTPSATRVTAMKADIRAKISYDLALLWPGDLKKSRKAQNNQIIGLSITTRGFGECINNHSQNCDAIVNAISDTLARYPAVKLRIFNICADIKDGDLAIAKHLLSRLSNWQGRIEIVEYDGQNLDPILSAIANCALMVSSRMHAGIMATLAGMPVFQISYAEKIRNFYSHSGLQIDTVVNDSELTYTKLSEFIANALNGDLDTYAAAQRQTLAQKGTQLHSDLCTIATSCSSH